MDYQKLDPALAAALSGQARGEPERTLPVFVHVTASMSADEAQRLTRRWGLEQPLKPGGVVTMTLPVGQVGELSDEPWVVAIRAARRLRSLDPES